MSSNKGKGILYQDYDDEPIQLPDQADEDLIKEYNLSLIGKILNPKKQNMERLIVAMLEQWAQDCLAKPTPVLTQVAPRENVFDRVRSKVPMTKQEGPSRLNVERGKDETSYRSHKDGARSTSRVQRSSHSSRENRVNNTCYNPYSYVRKQVIRLRSYNPRPAPYRHGPHWFG
ncbi:hypothetical protein DY000_02060536 [Brassica cretica]|uniref:Uncharacterized protein n=1 Tax=Brassica cretica TaxID=69181 RepID=A0ABQ7B4K3_BRACR|nr:hypothetical protein DY000_02060536 [Brassica cretica]